MVNLYGFSLSIAYIARRRHPYIESLPTLWLGPIWIRPHLDYASAIWSSYLSKEKIELENIQKKCMPHGYWTMGQQLLRSSGTCWPSNAWMSKVGNFGSVYSTRSSTNCYFNQETFTTSTSLSHHAPHSLVLNRPFARTNSYFYSFVPQSIFYWIHLLFLLLLFMPS